MHHRTVLICAILSLGLPLSAAGTERYQLKEDVKLFGFLPGHMSDNAESALPFDKSYQSLTVGQQGLLRSAYVEMGEADEPPFPLGGLKALYGPITEGHQRLMRSGTFSADVEIDAEGTPIAVAVHRSPSKAVTRFVSSIVMLTKFKPAVCAGSPCRMGFPVRIAFETR